MPSRLPSAVRRRALRLGLVQVGIWSAGYALTGATLVSYMAQDLGAKGWQLSLVLATPSLSGVLRLFTPALIARTGSTRRATLLAFGSAYIVLLGLPVTGAFAPLMSHGAALAVLIGVTCIYQLLDFIGFVSLWAWLGELVPLRIRGNYFAWRQTIQLAISIPVALAAGYFADFWKDAFKDSHGLLLLGYAIPNGLGALCMLASLWPLQMMPAVGEVPRVTTIPWRAMAAPFVDWRFRRVLSFRAVLSVANGISQAAQGIFPYRVLKLGAGDITVMRNVMNVGQIGVARWAGPFSDRFGNRPVLVVCQWIVSLAMVFYLFASPAPRWQAWLILGAYALWSFYTSDASLQILFAGVHWGIPAGHRQRLPWPATVPSR